MRLFRRVGGAEAPKNEAGHTQRGRAGTRWALPSRGKSAPNRSWAVPGMIRGFKWGAAGDESPPMQGVGAGKNGGERVDGLAFARAGG